MLPLSSSDVTHRTCRLICKTFCSAATTVIGIESKTFGTAVDNASLMTGHYIYWLYINSIRNTIIVLNYLFS